MMSTHSGQSEYRDNAYNDQCHTLGMCVSPERENTMMVQNVILLCPLTGAEARSALYEEERRTELTSLTTREVSKKKSTISLYAPTGVSG